MKSFEDGLYNLIEAEEEEANGCTVHDALQLVADMWDGSQEQADSRAAEEKRTAPEPRARPAFRFDP